MLTITARQMAEMTPVLERDRLLQLEQELVRRFPDLADPAGKAALAALSAAIRLAREYGFEQFRDIRSFVYLFAENGWDLSQAPQDAWVRTALLDTRAHASARLHWVRSTLESRKATETANEKLRADFLAVSHQRARRAARGSDGL